MGSDTVVVAPVQSNDRVTNQLQQNITQAINQLQQQIQSIQADIVRIKEILGI